jgi:membrane-bound inhibitor of C-type lysozyme
VCNPVSPRYSCDVSTIKIFMLTSLRFFSVPQIRGQKLRFAQGVAASGGGPLALLKEGQQFFVDLIL